MRVIAKVNCEINDREMQLLEKVGFVTSKILNNLDIVIGNINDDKLHKLDRVPFIEVIEVDEIYESQTSNVSIRPNLHQGHLVKHNLVGNNVRIALIDTGVNPNGIQLEGSINFTDTIDTTDAGQDNRLHGTYVAHVIKSIVPWCKLYNLRVKNSFGIIWRSAILEAIDWCIKNKITAINMSLGKKQKCNPTCLLCNSLKKVKDVNAIAVVAMGNYGTEGDGAVSCPAVSQYGFSVGAVDETRRLADYSSRGVPEGGKPNILAPGWVQITGDIPIEGTSFATPFITGVIASLYEIYDIKQILNILQETATDLKLPQHHQGSGLVSIENIVEVIKNEKSASTNH